MKMVSHSLLMTTFRLAWRNLWRNYRRTIIMLAAISLGVWAMIFMTALMRGMVDEMVLNGIRSLPGQVQMHHPNYRDDPTVVHRLPPPSSSLLSTLNGEHVKAWSTRVRVPAVLSSERDTRGVVAIGIEPGVEWEQKFFNETLVEGRFLQEDDDRGLVIGKKLAEQLETRLGKRVVLMSQDPDNNVVDKGFRIVGIYTARLPVTEERLVYAGKTTLQKLLNINDDISEIVVEGNNDYRHTVELQKELAEAAGENIETLAWQQIDTYLSTMIDMMDGFVLVWMVVVFLALSFGLVNTLVMAIFERVREIGLMLALGMKPGHILLQILLESLLLLTLGLLIGNVTAYLAIKPLESGIDISIVADGMAMMGAGSMLYPALKLNDVLLANGVVIILGLLTSLLPAWRASHLNPIHALTKT